MHFHAVFDVSSLFRFINASLKVGQRQNIYDGELVKTGLIAQQQLESLSFKWLYCTLPDVEAREAPKNDGRIMGLFCHQKNKWASGCLSFKELFIGREQLAPILLFNPSDDANNGFECDTSLRRHILWKKRS